MVSQERVNLIVTTCRLTEGTDDKCALYWPSMVDDDYFTLDLPDVKLEFISKDIVTPSLIRRKFSLTDPFTGLENFEIT